MLVIVAFMIMFTIVFLGKSWLSFGLYGLSLLIAILWIKVILREKKG